MTTITTNNNLHSVHHAAGPLVADGPEPVSATRHTGSHGTEKGWHKAATGDEHSAKSGGNGLSELLGGVLNFSGGSGASMLSSMVPGLGTLMTGLKMIFKSEK